MTLNDEYRGSMQNFKLRLNNTCVCQIFSLDDVKVVSL